MPVLVFMYFDNVSRMCVLAITPRVRVVHIFLYSCQLLSLVPYQAIPFEFVPCGVLHVFFVGGISGGRCHLNAHMHLCQRDIVVLFFVFSLFPSYCQCVSCSSKQTICRWPIFASCISRLLCCFMYFLVARGCLVFPSWLFVFIFFRLS